MSMVTLVLFILGFVLLIAGAELLVRGASKLALAVGISPLVVGLTVVAYGTSAPELAVTIDATYSGSPELAIGNVVGSNISNILLVLGIAAVVAGLTVDSQLIRIEVPLMIAISFLLLFMSLDGMLGVIDGIILAIGAVSYTVFVIRKSRKETKAAAEFTDVYDGDTDKYKSPKQIVLRVGMILVGLFLLVYGADWLINGATVIAELIGVSELVIGLTVVAVGTSLPEIATSIIASMRNQRDIAVGNAIGSNIFNILLVLGITAIVAPGGVPVPAQAVFFDMPIMIAASIACLPIFFTQYKISRWEGFLFLAYYITYTAYLYLRATNNTALDEFTKVMMYFFIPLTVITLIVLSVQAFRTNNKQSAVTSE